MQDQDQSEPKKPADPQKPIPPRPETTTDSDLAIKSNDPTKTGKGPELSK